ncbi:MAG: ABC transporter permease [Acidobacteriota bacterium]|jgi:peptide/nickel transport system permease protein
MTNPRQTGLWLGAVLVGLLTALALGGPALVDAEAVHRQSLEQRLLGPGPGHPLGMDDLGRDILARLMMGARASLVAATVVVLVSVMVGALLGGLAGYGGGLLDDLLMRLVDLLLAFPGVLLAIALVAVLGPGLDHAILALCVIGWVGFARLVRGMVLRVREMQFVQAARAGGAGPLRVLLRHVLPQTLGPVAIQASLAMAGVILAEASLSFLGLGIQPPAPSWGSMLRDSMKYLTVAPHLALAPGAAIAVAVFGFNFLGDGLRDALDPRGRQGRAE